LASGLFNEKVTEFEAPLSVLPSTVDWLLKAGFRPQFLLEEDSEPNAHQ
jgi:hypothetical protein